MLEKGENKEYLPIEGLASFRKATIDLMLGPNSKAAQEVRITLSRVSFSAPVSIVATFFCRKAV